MAQHPDEEAVADYLRAHPDFFVRHEQLLESLQVSLGDSRVISLQQYRLKQLQAAQADLTTRLNDLTLNAIDNERRLQYLRELATELLSRQSIEQALDKIDETLEKRFQVPLRRLLLALPEYPKVPFAAGISAEEMQRLRRQYQGAHPVVRGELQKLFPDADEALAGSLIVAPIAAHPAILVLGSHEPDRFSADQGRLFLDLLADLISALLTRQYHADPEPP